MTNQKLIAALAFALALQGCGLSKPTVEDVEPSVAAVLGQCPLWKISDLRKVDGISSAESYRIDFATKLVLKQSAEQTLSTFNQHQADPAYLTCHPVIGHLVILEGRVPKLSSEYEIKAAADLVKSEKGWRLSGELHDFQFTPTAVAIDARPLDRQAAVQIDNTVSIDPRNMHPTAGSASSSAVESTKSDAHTPAAANSPCVERGMAKSRLQRDKDLDEAGKAARAKGEELQISAGQDALVEQEALTTAKAACSGQ